MSDWDFGRVVESTASGRAWLKREATMENKEFLERLCIKREGNMRITRRDCEGAVDRLSEIVGKTLVVEYSGAPQRPRLALYDESKNYQMVRWVSPRLSTGEFYKHIWAMIDGIELFLRDD